ncbi:phosphotransferase family protein [Actinoplanes lobatus]|uniref:Ser/Thr protein kinase RdoA (MazF antagonist) n=1 Tax=Actinoplanes lobatus TaxID=113568 RepID=A0A7W7MIJ1_9ACTN|nr:phosphotransferase [Actinoplanes lobatus]MBB4751035.1 Ser/Thr protein kinase RdoA (MazF antagonist) [Actinoplanes lobatus]
MEVLRGGRLTAGVVRIGDTVRRPASPASAFTATLLAHLAAAGFDGAPRHLGRDDLGRDILTFLPGEVPAKWRAHDDGQVAAAAALMRRMHDASRDLAGDGRVVCHHDPGPNNTVFRDGRPVAFIDFDFAAPGDPLEDLGYLAWSWCISSKPERGDAARQAGQVRVLADAYGLTAARRRDLPGAVEQRLERNERFWEQAPAVTAGPSPAECLAWTRREKAFVRRFRDVFAAAMR